MSKEFVIPLNKTYSHNFDFLVNNKINEIDSSYNVVTREEDSKDYIINRAKEKTIDNVRYASLIMELPNDVKKHSTRDINGYLRAEMYVIHIKEEIMFDFDSISFVEETFTVDNVNSRKIKDTSISENSQKFDERYELKVLMNKFLSQSIDVEFITKRNYAVVVNNDKTTDVYITLPTWIKNDYDNPLVINKTWTIYNHTIKVSGYSYKNSVDTFHLGESDNNSRNLYSISESKIGGNITVYDSTTNKSTTIGEYKANQIMSKYGTRKRTIEIEMPLQKLYNKLGTLVYDIDIGEIPIIDDVFTCEDKNKLSDYSKINTIQFKVLKVEFSYNGVPKLIIKGKEI